MNKKTLLAAIGGLSALALAATCAPALAMGHRGHGHHGGDMKFFLLAHAAGISGETIHTAFKNDAALKTDFEALKTAKKAADTCIVAGNCTSGSSGQIATYAAAQSALAQEKLTVWQNIFAAKGVNNTAAVSLQTQLAQLDGQKRQLLHQAFGSTKGTDSVTPPAPQQ